MRALRLLLLALCLCVAPPAVRAAGAGEDDSNPHRMRGPDDEESCDFCHEEDMSLSQSPLDTCLTCHALTEHAGAAEHVRAKAAAVARARPTPVKRDGDAVELPLTEEGTIWCGTCHLYHDPQVNEEPLLSTGWLPATTGLAGAVGAAIAGRWGELAGKYEQPLPVARFAEQGSTWLRLPVSDGQLCTACHDYATAPKSGVYAKGKP